MIDDQKLHDCRCKKMIANKRSFFRYPVTNNHFKTKFWISEYVTATNYVQDLIKFCIELLTGILRDNYEDM